MGRPSRAIGCAAAVALLLAAAVAFGADRAPAGAARRGRDVPQKRDATAPSPRGARKGGEVRLDAVQIVGSAERPAILFFLPRAKFRLLPLRPEPDPASLLLRDDKLTREPLGE